MKQYLFQSQEMQIPQENVFTGMKIMPKSDKNLTEFLKQNFKFPSNNLKEICEFINEDIEMKKIIYDLPKIVSKEFPKTKILIDFVKYDYPHEKILKLIVKTEFDIETSINKEKILKDIVIDNYNTTKNEFFIRVEP